MRKHIITTVLAAAMAVSTGITSFAGQWVSDTAGWRWQNDDGSYLTNTWEWLDGNQDGIAECYYLGADGYMFHDTETPDGYTVNSDGAWTENGQVQIREQDTKEDFNSYDRYSIIGTYSSDKGAYVELNIGAENSLAGLFYDEEGDLTGIYTLEKISDNEYRDSASSKKITLIDSGTISINGIPYYN